MIKDFEVDGKIFDNEVSDCTLPKCDLRAIMRYVDEQIEKGRSPEEITRSELKPFIFE